MHMTDGNTSSSNTADTRELTDVQDSQMNGLANRGLHEQEGPQAPVVDAQAGSAIFEPGTP